MGSIGNTKMNRRSGYHQVRHIRQRGQTRFKAGNAYADTSKEIINIINEFKDFAVVDYDDNYVYLRKVGVGVVEARIIRGSLGSYDYKFVVEKFGERSKLFSGKNAIIRIHQYLR